MRLLFFVSACMASSQPCPASLFLRVGHPAYKTNTKIVGPAPVRAFMLVKKTTSAQLSVFA